MNRNKTPLLQPQTELGAKKGEEKGAG